ncbi:MAG: MFS transporter [Chloroflexi bacterium]|nr:MFS transporter [Chloroflexota bacterium]
MVGRRADNSRAAPRHVGAWPAVLALFCITSVVEAIGVSQVFAFLPIYVQGMGLSEAEVPHWVGLLSSLVFVLGLPLVPFWGVWADKYSRKAVVIRSSLVEALVFSLMALSREPWQLAGSMLLVGFQLGNTGVMLAAIRDVTPKRRLGASIALFGATTPVGMAAGPVLGGFIVDGLGASLSVVYLSSAALSLAVCALLGLGLREVQPDAPPEGRVLDLAYDAMRGVFSDANTRRLFLLFGISIIARQMSNPFLPLLVERLNVGAVGLASAIAFVVGTAALVGGLISPAAGAVGDRIGFRPVLAVSLVGAGLMLIAMPFAPDIASLAGVNVGFAAFNATVSAMIFALVAVEGRGSATLNLVYLPLYITGIIGPAISAIIVGWGLPVVFVTSGLLLSAGGLFAVARLVRDRQDAR